MKDQNRGSNVSIVDSQGVPIPLPTEIPSAPDLRLIPQEVLHSATVEALLSHIDDLTARLKVNLRRNSSLESDLKSAKNSLELLKERTQTLELRDLIVQERTVSAEKRFQQLSDKIVELEDQVSVYETRLAKALFENHKAQSLEQETTRKARRLKAIRSKVKDRIKSYIKEHTSSLQAEIWTLEGDLKSSAENNIKLKSQLADLRGRLESTTKRLQEKEHEFRDLLKGMENEKDELISKLQQELEQKTKEISEHQSQIKRLKEETIDSEDIFNRNISLQNELSELKESFNSQIIELQKEVVQYRSETKRTLLDKSELEKKVDALRREINSSKFYSKRLEDQLESALLLLDDYKKRTQLIESFDPNQAFEQDDGDLTER